MATDKDFSYESIQDAESIKEYIEAVLQGIETGRISLSSNGDEMVLTPGSLLKFSIKARQKGEVSKLSLKISWKDDRKVSIDPKTQIEISS